MEQTNHSETFNSGSRDINSVVLVLLSMNGSSEELPGASGASDDASDSHSTVSDAYDGQSADFLAVFAQKCTGMCISDLREYIRRREFATFTSHSRNC